MKPDVDESLLSQFHAPIAGGAKGEEATRVIPPLSGTIEAQTRRAEEELREIVDNAPVFLWSDLRE